MTRSWGRREGGRCCDQVPGGGEGGVVTKSWGEGGVVTRSRGGGVVTRSGGGREGGVVTKSWGGGGGRCCDQVPGLGEGGRCCDQVPGGREVL